MVRDVAVTPRGCVIDCGAADIGLIAHNERSRTRDALREWLRRGGKPARLIEIASHLPRAKSPVLDNLR